LLRSTRGLGRDRLRSRGDTVRIAAATSRRRQWLLEHLNLLATGGFYEYKAIPYQRYSYYALSNLADLADDADPVKTAARLLIRYLEAKFVLGSIDLRRNAALRRRNETAIADSQTFFSIRHDVQSGRWIYFSGKSVGIDDGTQLAPPH
jgi:hypothetical protein